MATLPLLACAIAAGDASTNQFGRNLFMNIDLTVDRGVPCDDTFPGTSRSSVTRRCMRCGGALQSGLLMEDAEAFEPATPLWWQPGPSSETNWMGVTPEPSRQRRVVARRCERCGGLELFAL